MIVSYERKHKQQLLELWLMIHRESSFKSLAVNAEKLMRCMDNPALRVRLAIVGNELAGFFAGYVTTPFFSDEKVGYDLGWVMSPKHRGGSAAIRLLRDFESWASGQGARLLILSQTTSINVSGVARLYERNGYSIVGVNAMKEI